MTCQKTDRGLICVESAVYTNVAGYAATNCFGVKGMATRSVTDGLIHLLRREAMGKGVHITFHEDDGISIDLHIVVDRGVNLCAISSSIINEVRYHVHRMTGTDVRNINVFIDSINVN